MTLDTPVTISEHAVFRELEGEAVILDLQNGRYFGLDTVGTRIWQLLNERATLRGVHGALVEEYDVTPDALERDLLTFAHDLAARGLLTTRS